MIAIKKQASACVLGLALFTASAANAEGVALSPNAAADLLYQLEMLQQEVSSLRGRLEEQEHELNKMRERQRDRYVDLDRRISLLLTQQVQPAAVDTAVVAAADSSPDVAPPAAIASLAITGTVATTPVASVSVATAPVVLQAPAADVEESYKAAYELIRNKKFDQAKAAFEQFVLQHPNVTLTGNAYYWLGELELVLGNPAGAINQFSVVVNKFVGHSKVADATYKLGIVSDQIGQQYIAIQYMQRVVSDFPDSSAATKATAYLTNLK